MQGVFFRATVKEHADKLRIKGFVRNLTNGSVELRAIGEKKQLEKLVESIKKEPGKAFISKVIVDYAASEKPFSGFKILR